MSFVQAKNSGPLATAANTVSAAAFGASVTAGDFLWAVVTYASSGTVSGVTLGGQAATLQASSVVTDSLNSQTCAIYYVLNATGGTTASGTLTMTGSTAFCGITVVERSETVTAADGAAVKWVTPGATTGVTAAFTPTQAGDYMAFAIVDSSGTTTAINTPTGTNTTFAVRDTETNAGIVEIAVADGIQTAAASTTGTWTWTTSGTVLLALAAFKVTSTTPRGALRQPGPGVGPVKRLQFQSGTVPGQTPAGVTLALTGQAATFSQGTLTGFVSPTAGANLRQSGPGVSPFNNNQFLPSIKGRATSTDVTQSLTGLQITSQTGTLVSNISYGLTGSVGAFSQGTLATSIAYALTGQVGTWNQGTVVPNIAYGLTGAQAVWNQGTVTTGSDVTLALTGQAATFATGTMVGNVAYALTGAQATYSQGALVSTPSYGLTGQVSTFSTGTLAPATSVGLTGQQAVWNQGSVGVAGDITLALTGMQIAFSQGSLANGTPVNFQHGGDDAPKSRKKKFRIRIEDKVYVATEAQIAVLAQQMGEKGTSPQINITTSDKKLRSIATTAYAAGYNKPAIKSAPAPVVEEDDDDEDAILLLLG